MWFHSFHWDDRRTRNATPPILPTVLTVLSAFDASSFDYCSAENDECEPSNWDPDF